MINIRFVSLIFSLIILLLLSACSPSDDSSSIVVTSINAVVISNTDMPTVTSTNTPLPTLTPSATSTPTSTPTLTLTRTPTPTAIPELLDDLPTSFRDGDLTIVSKKLAFQILRVDSVETSFAAPENTNRKFILVRGIVYNYDEKDYDLHDVDFTLMTDDTTTAITPNYEMMVQLHEQFYRDHRYPEKNLLFEPNYTVPALKASRTLLVYEVSNDIQRFTFYFMTDTPRARLGVLLIPNGPNAYLPLKESENDVVKYVIEVLPQREVIEELLDIEEVDVDNCYGTDTITRRFTFTQETINDFKIGATDSGAGASIRLGTGQVLGALGAAPFASLLPDLEVAARSANALEEQVSMSKLVQMRTEELTASPGTRPRWQMKWYRVAIQGELLVNIGEQEVYIPYLITENLRSSLESVPSDPCK